jgi:hypothetical protein
MSDKVARPASALGAVATFVVHLVAVQAQSGVNQLHVFPPLGGGGPFLIFSLFSQAIIH